jgi:hypothetical protein
MARVASLALAVAAILAATSAGLLGYEGWVAGEPAEYAISGTVYEDTGGGHLAPAGGATVVLSVNGNAFATYTTGLSGTFDFPAVPAGGFELNVTAYGYGPTVVYTFASRSYSTATQGLQIALEPGGPSNTSVTALTPFGDLETLLAYVGGAAVLLAGGAAVAGGAAYALRRPGGSVTGVIGAGAAVSIPAIVLLLSLGGVFPYVSVVAGVVGGVGGFALVLTTVDVASRPPIDPPP